MYKCDLDSVALLRHSRSFIQECEYQHTSILDTQEFR